MHIIQLRDALSRLLSLSLSLSLCVETKHQERAGGLCGSFRVQELGAGLGEGRGEERRPEIKHVFM